MRGVEGEMGKRWVRAVRWMFLFGMAAMAGPGQAADAMFEVWTLEHSGRTVAAHGGDFDGDGRADLATVTIEGPPYAETRQVRVFLQQQDGRLPEVPSHLVALPHGAGVYDVADLVAWPGDELVVLQPRGVSLLSLANAEGRRIDHEVAGGTVATTRDERGFEPFRLVDRSFADEPWLVVPQFGRVVMLSKEGAERARFDVGQRSNYYVLPPGGLVSAESDFQLFIDLPKIAAGDVDGDGRRDFVSATRHEIRVFLRREDGGFDEAPSRRIPLAFISPRDHIRGTGGVSCEFRDYDADGRIDLLISHVEGSINASHTTTRVFRNEAGSWDLASPVAVFESDGALASDTLVDVEGDGTLELLRIQMQFGVFEFVELLLTREIDAEFAIHRIREGRFEREPWLERSLGIPFSLETFRAEGFLPTIRGDLDDDGHADLVTSGSGDDIAVYLGAANSPFKRRSGRQPMATAGVIDFHDFDGDGLQDLLIYDPHHFDAPVTVAINTGWLEEKTKGPRSRRQRGASLAPAPGAGAGASR